ncbi:MAG TPA: putative toxin-antitoxin system toxin component, PIN family [Actinomycetota bacterium]
MRAVLDTNILISAFVFPGGPPEAVYRLAIERRIELVTSPDILAEFGRILLEKFDWDPTKVELAVAQVARTGTVVRPAEVVRVIAEDPEDDRILEAARAAGAEVVVSGDRHLLRLGEWQGIRILRAAGLLDELSGR